MDLLKEKIKLIQELKARGIKNQRVLKAIYIVKRELFVPKNLKERAYENRPLYIGQGQTISQPYTVARMVELLDVKKGNKILEIGSGSGYNAAVLAYLVGKEGKIYSIEIRKELAKLAKNNLEKAGIKNVQVIIGNGYYGYKDKKPYNRIIVTAAADEIPRPLIEQLKNKGIMVIPIKKSYADVMTRIIKDNNEIKITEHGDYSFVPFKKSLEES